MTLLCISSTDKCATIGYSRWLTRRRGGRELWCFIHCMRSLEVGGTAVAAIHIYFGESSVKTQTPSAEHKHTPRKDQNLWLDSCRFLSPAVYLVGVYIYYCGQRGSTLTFEGDNREFEAHVRHAYIINWTRRTSKKHIEEKEPSASKEKFDKGWRA